MSFTLDKRDIDKRTGAVPLYQQIADLLQQAIEAGELKPGDPIPSEVEMARTTEISRPQIRAGVSELVQTGLLVKRHGAVTKVAAPPRLRSLDASRYQEELDLLRQGGEHPKTSAFVTEFGVDWADYTIETNYQRGQASATDAQYLAIAEGEPVVRRQLLKFVNGEPQQLNRSTVPWSIAEGTVLENPQAQPYPGGTIAELYSAGYEVTRVVEEPWARMPTGEERRALQLIQAAPVWDIVRIMHTADRAVEVSRVITAAATSKLRFVTDLR